MIASGFSWMHLIPGVQDDALFSFVGVQEHNQTIMHVLLVCVMLLTFSLLGRMGLESVKKKEGISKYFADEGFSFRNMGELYIGAIRGMMGDVLEKKDVQTFFPFIGTVFIYIFTCNILGIFPGFLPPTDNMNTNIGMAFLSFFLFNAVGLYRGGFSYLKHFLGPVWWLIPLMLVVELISTAVRPLTLAVRLTGNMFGDHTVFVEMSNLVSVPLFYPALLLCLATIVSLVQAFVFSMLSTVYIALALPHHEDDH